GWGRAHGRGAGPRDEAQAGADRVGRDHDHRNGRARGGPARGGSRNAHRALNDRDTVPRRLSLLKTSSTRASLVIPAAHWAEWRTTNGSVARWSHEQDSCSHRYQWIARAPCPAPGGAHDDRLA